jgi:hypothetical protein
MQKVLTKMFENWEKERHIEKDLWGIEEICLSRKTKITLDKNECSTYQIFSWLIMLQSMLIKPVIKHTDSGNGPMEKWNNIKVIFVSCFRKLKTCYFGNVVSFFSGKNIVQNFSPFIPHFTTWQLWKIVKNMSPVIFPTFSQVKFL